jgi:enoyl-[acyl-carrier protein] reductase I
MGLLEGKVAAIFGVANKRSIAWGIAQAMAREGAAIALNYQNDRMREGVEKLAEELDGQKVFLAACDVTNEDEIRVFFDKLAEQHPRIDALVHSIATAKRDELGGRFSETSWEGFALSQQVSAYSLIPLAREAARRMEGGDGSIVCLSYYGAEKVVKNYNVMGVAKASLEATTRYLADDLGPNGVRVNAVSAGPIKTVSAMGVSGFGDMLADSEKRAPLRRNVSQDDVGNTAAFLCSDLARGITGQTIYVDAGLSILGL